MMKGMFATTAFGQRGFPERFQESSHLGYTSNDLSKLTPTPATNTDETSDASLVSMAYIGPTSSIHAYRRGGEHLKQSATQLPKISPTS